MIEKWIFDEEKRSSNEYDRRIGTINIDSSDGIDNLAQMYAQMTGHCRGGLRLLYLHFQWLRKGQ